MLYNYCFNPCKRTIVNNKNSHEFNIKLVIYNISNEYIEKEIDIWIYSNMNKLLDKYNIEKNKISNNIINYDINSLTIINSDIFSRLFNIPDYIKEIEIN